MRLLTVLRDAFSRTPRIPAAAARRKLLDLTSWPRPLHPRVRVFGPDGDCNFAIRLDGKRIGAIRINGQSWDSHYGPDQWHSRRLDTHEHFRAAVQRILEEHAAWNDGKRK